MSGNCDKCNEHCLDCKCDLNKCILERIKDLGRIEERILAILDDDVFSSLSKHDPYWHHEDVSVEDRMSDIRMTFGLIADRLDYILRIINKCNDL